MRHVATHDWMGIQGRWIRCKGNLRSQWGGDTWQQVLSNLTHLGLTCEMGREGGKIERKKKEREPYREKLYLLSKFPDDRTGSFQGSKKKSASPR